MKSKASRSSHAQLQAMGNEWPDFIGKRGGDGLIAWRGVLRPRAMPYAICVLWWPGKIDRPYVMVIDPPIAPPEGKTYAQIPHLMYNADKPELSGLCLFDPEGKEWTPADLIAETTMRWASEWLHYYELWHMCGEWLAPGVGPESVASLTRSEADAIEEAAAHVH